MNFQYPNVNDKVPSSVLVGIPDDQDWSPKPPIPLY